MVTGDRNKIPEKHSGFSHHSQASFSIYLNFWAILGYRYRSGGRIILHQVCKTDLIR